MKKQENHPGLMDIELDAQFPYRCTLNKMKRVVLSMTIFSTVGVIPPVPMCSPRNEARISLKMAFTLGFALSHDEACGRT